LALCLLFGTLSDTLSYFILVELVGVEALSVEMKQVEVTADWLMITLTMLASSWRLFVLFKFVKTYLIIQLYITFFTFVFYLRVLRVPSACHGASPRRFFSSQSNICN
jgi:hypothetical protein